MDIKVCCHCGDRCSGDYCVKCNSIEKRLAQDEANREHFEAHGLTYQSPCSKCVCEQSKKSKTNI